MSDVTSVTITKNDKGGAYQDILEVASELKRGVCGSAANAIATMVRDSPLYKQTRQRLSKSKSVPRGTSVEQHVDSNSAVAG